MIFRPCGLADAFVIDPEPRGDERGFFARVFCDREFQAAGIAPPVFLQANVSRSARRGTLRGLHYQRAPHAEAKLVRCTHGALHDVIVDLRPDSPTFRRWHGEVLSRANRRMLWVPEGFAHGFLTLADDTEIHYQVTARYAPGHEAGVRWDDPAIGVQWPEAPVVLSDRDLALPLLDPA